MKITANYYTEEKNKLVKIVYNEEIRIFKVYSARAGNCLCLMAENFPEGITTKDMRDKYGIDDNKLFGELLDQSGFREFMEHIGTKDKLKLWKIRLDELFEATKDIEQPIWFGIIAQGNLQKHLPILLKKQGLNCNILGIKLLEEEKEKFLSNFRKIAIDHRVPLLKKGNDTIENLQILSYYVNERKNQVCAKCINSKCEICALAFPEKFHIVFPTQENIQDILKKF